MSHRLICSQQQPPRFPGFGWWLRGILLHGESRRVPWFGHGMGMVLGTPVTCCPTTVPLPMAQTGGKAVPLAPQMPPWDAAAPKAFSLHQVARRATRTRHCSMACAF